MNFQNLNAYIDTLKECIDECKYPIVILIDSIDESDDLSWMPTQLNEYVKIIITTTSTIGGLDNAKDDDIVPWMKNRIPKENFVQIIADVMPIQTKVTYIGDIQ